MVAAITLRKREEQRQHRLELSWQTRNLAMIIAAAGANANEDLMKFASNLTIDNEEYELFNSETVQVEAPKSKVPVHGSTQDEATKANFERASDKNSFDMLAMFAHGMETAAPGQ